MEKTLSSYKLHLQKNNVSFNTTRGYLSDLNKFMEWYQGTRGFPFSATNINCHDIVEFKRYLKSINQKPATINRVLRAFSSFFSFAIGPEHGLMAGVKSLKIAKAIPKVLTIEEQQNLMRVVYESKNPRDIAIITLLLHTGLRVGEIGTLKVGDVHFGDKSGYVIVEKRGKIPFDDTVWGVLKDWVACCNEEPLFPSQKGGCLTARGIRFIVEKYAHEAGLESITPRVLQRTFCKSLLEAGVSPDKIVAIVGYKNIDIVEKCINPVQKNS